MQLNVLDDLAEAMKALDGKKAPPQERWRDLDFSSRKLRRRPTPADLANFAPRKLICGGMLQHKNNSIQFLFPLRIAGPKQSRQSLSGGSRQVVYQAGKTIAFCKFTELMQWQHQSWRQCAYKRELRRIDLLSQYYDPHGVDCLSPLSLPPVPSVSHAGPRPSVLFICLTVRRVVWPLFHYFGMYMCAGFLGLLSRPSLLLVAFFAFVRGAVFSLLCLAASLSGRAFPLLPLFCLFAPGCVWLGCSLVFALFPSLPLGAWRCWLVVQRDPPSVVSAWVSGCYRNN